jgi:hypothetical protein
MSKRRPKGIEGETIRRAAKTLLEAHGAGDALGIARRRADNAERAGAAHAAARWHEIARIIAAASNHAEL